MAGFPAILRLAARGLLRNRRRSLLTGATIALGVVAILFTQAYIAGLRQLIRAFVVDGRDGALQVQRRGYLAAQELAPLDLDLPSEGGLVERLGRVPAIAAVAPRLRFVGLLANGETSTGIVGIAIDPARDRRVCPKGPGSAAARDPASPIGLVDGRGLRDADEPVAVVAAGLAAALGLHAGARVTLLAQTASGATDAVDLTVAGIYRLPDPEEDKHTVVVALPIAQRLLHMPGRATALALAVRDPNAVADAVAAVRAAVADVTPELEVHPWGDLAPYHRDIVKLQDDVLGVVLAIVFVLVLVGVVNSMLMSVFERTREIGTLMSIGLRRRRILTLFLLESLALGSAAALVGIGLGVLLIGAAHAHGVGFDIPAVGRVLNRPTLAPIFVLYALGGAALAGVAGGVLPAVRASRLRPIEALRAT